MAGPEEMQCRDESDVEEIGINEGYARENPVKA
jgi:hypothetical protein